MVIHGWSIPDGDHHFFEALQKSFLSSGIASYQNMHRSCALSHVKSFRLAIDIGAHVGFWSRELTNRFSNVYSFEPSIQYISHLRINAPDAQIFPFALGAAEGFACLKVPEGNSGAAYISIEEKSDEVVEVRTLDSFKFRDIDFIKIDCEGYEYPVLLGAIQTIRSNRPVICIEQKKSAAGHYDQDMGQYHEIKFLVEQLNYRIIDNYIDDWILESVI